MHTVTTTPANGSDVIEVDKLLHGKEKTFHADAGYIGAEKRNAKARADLLCRRQRGSVKAMLAVSRSINPRAPRKNQVLP